MKPKTLVLLLLLACCRTQSETLESETAKLEIDPNGRIELYDKRANVRWGSVNEKSILGQVAYKTPEGQRKAELSTCKIAPVVNGLNLEFANFPRPFTIAVKLLPDGNSFELSWQNSPGFTLDSVHILQGVLDVKSDEQGKIVAPVREGLLIPSDSGLNFNHRFDSYAYEGCHMAMLGAIKSGAAALLTWSDPYVAVDLRSVATNKQQVLSPSLFLRKSANSFRIHLLGKGDHVTIAKAYRKIAQQGGWLVTWKEKLAQNPARSNLFGAINFKLWSALDRRMNESSSQEEKVQLNWTFEEAAQVAEHLKNDLKLDRVLFTVGGWIHRGYDNQHPDILPAAPECGGDAGLAALSKRVRDLGYIFCLHDNYQDIYKDAPSWNEEFIMKTPDGKLAKGGHWAGGVAYLTCSLKATELAKRPQNLPAVKQLTHADAYFIDTTYAAGLQECFDPKHPLTRADDMHWKQAISDYAREQFGIFGSECGREWAIPHSDFFEGLTGVSGRNFHDTGLEQKLGAKVIPLFELVYRDCIAMYGKYGYNPANSSEYVLQHILWARPLNYHNVPAHLYWKSPATQEQLATNEVVFTSASGGWAEGLNRFDRFVKNTAEILSPMNEITAQEQMTSHGFLDSKGKVQRVAFGEGVNRTTATVNFGPTPYEFQSRFGGKTILPPDGFLIESPTFIAFCALRWNGMDYDAPSLFTLRGDGLADLEHAKAVRVFHGFGPQKLNLAGKVLQVAREQVSKKKKDVSLGTSSAKTKLLVRF